MVSNEGLQRKIAEVLGWDELGNNGEGLFGRPPNAKLNQFVPNWPTDRNASGNLEIRNHARYMNSNLDFSKYYPEENDLYVPESARVESLKWLLYKGWRWVECDECLDGGIPTHPAGEPVPCEDCNGDGGEWVQTKMESERA